MPERVECDGSIVVVSIVRGIRTRYLVSPFLARVLFVVAAAIRSAVLLERPRADSLRLMCSYWRLRFALVTPRGGARAPP